MLGRSLNVVAGAAENWVQSCPFSAGRGRLTTFFGFARIKKKGRIPARIPCPVWLFSLLFEFPGGSVFCAEFVDLAMGKVCNLRDEEQFTRIEAVG